MNKQQKEAFTQDKQKMPQEINSCNELQLHFRLGQGLDFLIMHPQTDRLFKIFRVEYVRNQIMTTLYTKSCCIQNTLKFKQELIAAAYHPKRFLKWCLDTDEVKELNEDLSPLYHI